MICLAIFPILATYTSSKTIATVHLCLGVSLGGVTFSGAGINYLDIAPRYSGIILGISNTFGTIAGIFSPYVTNAMTSAPPGSHVSHRKHVNNLCVYY